LAGRGSIGTCCTWRYHDDGIERQIRRAVRLGSLIRVPLTSPPALFKVMLTISIKLTEIRPNDRRTEVRSPSTISLRALGCHAVVLADRFHRAHEAPNRTKIPSLAESEERE
jgi:hypothetical protein